MGKKYYRNEQLKLAGQACLLETWHETRAWYESNIVHSKVTHHASNAQFEKTGWSYHESDPAAKSAAIAYITNWLQQQEIERRRKEEERRRLEAMRRAEQRLREQQEELDRIQREQRAEMLRQRQEHQRQLRQSQILSLNVLKNEKSAERQRIITHELSPVQARISSLNTRILTEEKEIYKFTAERNDRSHQTIVLMGMTGDGKSTFGNRLCGDISFMANETGPYKTSDNSQSCTQLLQKWICDKLSVIDCPGWSDTEDNDRSHSNNLCAYLKGCGGVNAFVVIRNGTNCRFDAYFQTQLLCLERVFGAGFWNHLIVVLTHIEKGFATLQFENGNKAQQIKDNVARLCNDLNIDPVTIDVPVIPIGLDNYTEQIAQFKESIPQNRFTCDNIKSPIDGLRSDKEALINQQTAIQQRIDSITNEMNDIDAQISNL